MKFAGWQTGDAPGHWSQVKPCMFQNICSWRFTLKHCRSSIREASHHGTGVPEVLSLPNHLWSCMDHEEACPSCPCISSAFATLGTWIDILSVLCFSALDFLYASFPFSTHCFCYVSWSMKVFLSSMLLRLVLAFLQVVGKNGRGSGCKS